MATQKKKGLDANSPAIDRLTGRLLATDGKAFRYMGAVELKQNKRWRRVTNGRVEPRRPDDSAKPIGQLQPADTAGAPRQIERKPDPVATIIDGGIDEEEQGEEVAEGQEQEHTEQAGDKANGSKSLTIPDAFQGLKECTTKKQVESWVEGDERAQVVKAAAKRIAELSK